MKEKIIRLSELVDYHRVKEVYKNTVACFTVDNRLVNIDTIPPVCADIFSFILVKKGTAVFSLNYREQKVAEGDLLLFWPSLFVSLTRQSDDFTAQHLLCERSLFERLLASRPEYQRYSLFFCQTEYPVVHLNNEQMQSIDSCMQQITRCILHPGSYQEDILHHLLHTCLLLTLEQLETLTAAHSTVPNHTEVLFQQFISLLIQHYKEEHGIEFYARQLAISTTYLSRIIRQVTHKTAGYFITGLLYAEACRMLIHSDLTIQSIADKLHFSDQSAFGKFFKANAGVSPLRYRIENAIAEPASCISNPHMTNAPVN